MLAVFTNANEFGFEPGLNSPESLALVLRWHSIYHIGTSSYLVQSS